LPNDKDGSPVPEEALVTRDLCAGYGDVRVLWGVDLRIEPRTIGCLVGSNGAGKSTLLRTISGLITPTSGSIRFGACDLTGASPDRVLAAGIAHVPEGRRLFKGLTVRDNLLLGAYLRRETAATLQRDLEAVYALFPILKERHDQDATTMSGGEQQMCAIGRGLMAKPKLLMIDELSLGLSPKMVEHLVQSLLEVSRTGVTILLVEQDVFTAFGLATYAYVVETGRIAFEGPTQTLGDDPRIRQAYLGL
jgi:branched-chain amino acid transport system ATP-binding protein